MWVMETLVAPRRPVKNFDHYHRSCHRNYGGKPHRALIDLSIQKIVVKLAVSEWELAFS